MSVNPRPPLLIAPNPVNDTTAGVPWRGYGPPQPSVRTTGLNAAPASAVSTGTTQSGPRYMWTTAGPVALPANMSDADANEMIRRYDAYIADLQKAFQESSGFQRMQLEAQIKDAEAGRRNAIEIARMNNETSRYGTDVNRQVQMAQLKENQRQFDARHGLEREELGLRRAQTATEYLATPDRWAQAGNFLALSGRIAAGQPGVGTHGRAVAPRPNTMADYAVLESGGNPYANRGDATQAAGAGGAGGDARQKAIKAVLGSYTPSQGVGLDANDYAVLNATQAIMNMNLTPQAQASIRSAPEYQAILGSNMKNLGQDPSSWWRRQQQSLPGQGSARAA